MSREIKFRAWDKRRKVYAKAIQTTNQSWKGYRDKTFVSEGIMRFSKWVLSRFIIEQYTGLRDKNGIGIYEGDLVRNCDKCHVDNEEVYAVKITDDAYLLPFRSSFGSWSPELCEVVGNIHESNMERA